MTLVINSVSHALLKLLDIDLRRNTGIALPQGGKRIVPPLQPCGIFGMKRFTVTVRPGSLHFLGPLLVCG